MQIKLVFVQGGWYIFSLAAALAPCMNKAKEYPVIILHYEHDIGGPHLEKKDIGGLDFSPST